MKRHNSIKKLATLALLPFACLLQAVEINAPFVRQPLPGAPNGAAFMQLVNDSTQALSIVSATSSASEYCELHTHIHDNGVMRMRQVEAIEIPAQGSVELKPGGLHLMLFNIQPLSLDDQVELTLTFSDGSSKTVTAPVKSLMPHQQMTHAHAMQHGSH